MNFSKRRSTMLLCISICAGLSVLNPVTSSPISSNETVKNIESGKKYKSEVLDSKLPVLVDFYAEWCGPCKRQSPIIDRLAKSYKGKVKFVKLDIDRVPEIADRYSVQSIPTIMLFKNGKKTIRLQGLQDTGDLKALLEDHLNSTRK